MRCNTIFSVLSLGVTSVCFASGLSPWQTSKSLHFSIVRTSRNSSDQIPPDGLRNIRRGVLLPKGQPAELTSKVTQHVTVSLSPALIEIEGEKAVLNGDTGKTELGKFKGYIGPNYQIHLSCLRNCAETKQAVDNATVFGSKPPSTVNRQIDPVAGPAKEYIFALLGVGRAESLYSFPNVVREQGKVTLTNYEDKTFKVLGGDLNNAAKIEIFQSGNTITGIDIWELPDRIIQCKVQHVQVIDGVSIPDKFTMKFDGHHPQQQWSKEEWSLDSVEAIEGVSLNVPQGIDCVDLRLGTPNTEWSKQDPNFVPKLYRWAGALPTLDALKEIPDDEKPERSRDNRGFVGSILLFSAIVTAGAFVWNRKVSKRNA